MKKILVTFLIISSTFTIAQEEILLRLHYKKGDSYRMNMKMNQSIGTAMNSDMNLSIVQNIIEVSEDIHKNTMKIKRIQMNVSQDGNLQTYDSSLSEEEQSDFGKQVAAQMGAMLTATIYSSGNNLGEVIEMKTEPIIPGIDKLADSNSIVYPKEPVKTGSSWNMVKNESGIEMTFIYTVKSISKKEIVLDVSGTNTGLASGTIEGNISINPVTGIPTTSKIITKMDIGGQEMVIAIDVTMTKL